MPRKEWSANHKGHTIKVIHTWLNVVELYVDGESKDRQSVRLIASFKDPLFTYSLPEEGGKSINIEIFVKAIFAVRIKICADGSQIGGDAF